MQINDTHHGRHRTAILAVTCVLLQVMLSPHIGMGNGRMNFAIVFAAVHALTIGGRSSVYAGFAAGLVFDLLSTGPIGLMAGLLTVFAYVLGLEERNRFVDGPVVPLSSYGIASLVVCVAYHLALSLVGEPVDVFDLIMMRALPTFALTFVAFLPFVYVEVKDATSGRPRGGSQKGGGLRGGHYDLKSLRN